MRIPFVAIAFIIRYFRISLLLTLGTAYASAQTSVLPDAKSADAARGLVRNAIFNYEKSRNSTNEYTFLSESIERELDANGKTQKQTSLRSARLRFADVTFGMVVERNGTRETEAALNESWQQRIPQLEEWATKTPAQRNAELAQRKRGRTEMDFLREMPDALDYQPLATETWQGRTLQVFAVSPRPGYKPQRREGKVWSQVKGKLWIDTRDQQIRQFEAMVMEDVSFGGFLASILKGTEFFIRRSPVDSQQWMNEELRMRFSAKVLLVKSIREENITRWSNWAHKRDAVDQRGQRNLTLPKW
jgi:hypothetical protein